MFKMFLLLELIKAPKHIENLESPRLVTPAVELPTENALKETKRRLSTASEFLVKHNI